eukprot:SAG11_NODE_3251_length_2580_cov_3.804111_4_plen_71_part_00
MIVPYQTLTGRLSARGRRRQESLVSFMKKNEAKLKKAAKAESDLTGGGEKPPPAPANDGTQVEELDAPNP